MPAPRGSYVTDCLAEGLVDEMPWHLRARRMRQDGCSYFEISVELLMSYSAIHAFFNVKYYRHKLDKQRAYLKDRREKDYAYAKRERQRCRNYRRHVHAQARTPAPA